MTDPLGRLIACTRCGMEWDVIEAGHPWIDPARYVCPDHRTPVDHAEQLELDTVQGHRIEEPAYDPDMSQIPL